MHTLRIPLLMLGVLLSGGALAEPDTFGLGSGRDGDLEIESGSRIVNRYAQLLAPVAAGGRDLTVSDTTGFTPGGLVLLHQSLGLTQVPASGEQQPICLGGDVTVGRFEYARVEAVSSGALRLTAPLLNRFPAGVTQVVSVPEYTELRIRPGAELRAMPWNGSVGGILAVMASVRLRNDGFIIVDGAGFRGGAFFNHANLNGCSNLDEPVASGGSYKGEGLVAGRYGTASGRGNLANGGGGGNCHNAGGGGGGHGGTGGIGGRSGPVDEERDVGGLGGAPLVYLPYERIVFGGGGGAGEGNNDAGTGGGAGGGLMLIRAQEVRGSGRYRANGSTPSPTPGGDGAGGGGAGGAISVRAVSEIECGSMEARGGAGGDSSETDFSLGPGGGGGGGVIFLQAPSRQCPGSVIAGAAGADLAADGSHGAGPSSVSSAPAVGSSQIVTSPFRQPGVPTLTQPVDGATGVSPRPRIEGTAAAGARVYLFLDGAPFATVEAGSNGAFSLDVSEDLASGPHVLSAFAEVLGVHSTASAPRRFDVETPADGGVPDAGVDAGTDAGVDAGTDAGVDAGTDAGADAGVDAGVEEPAAFQVGCGCGASPSAGVGIVALLLGAWATHRRRMG
jgi:hypothetical protein